MKTFGFLAGRPTLWTIVVAGAGLVLKPGAAPAACALPAANNVTATCTGSTVNQGPGFFFGYGDNGLTGLGVTVVQGASVAGTNVGIGFATGSVLNYGTVTATNSSGISASGAAGDIASMRLRTVASIPPIAPSSAAFPTSRTRRELGGQLTCFERRTTDASLTR